MKDPVLVPPLDPDFAIRQAAFEHLDRLVALHGPVLPWSVIQQGFAFRGERVLLGSIPRGLHRPKLMEEHDGPVLEQAIKGFDQKRIQVVPRRKMLRP